ncbi:MAG: hypothetical protein AB1726_12895, partial [Planctomycetota bacterium]
MPREAAPPPPARRRALAALATIFLAPALLLGPHLIAGERFLPYLPRIHEPLRSEDPAAAEEAIRGASYPPADRIFPVLTDQEAIAAEIAAGHLPTWQPLHGLGVPLFAGTIAGAAYPPNWLALALSPELAAGPLALLSLALAGLGTWLLLRRLGLARGACVVGALGVELGGWGIGNLFYPMKVDAALWVPWALWAVEGLARRRRGSAPALTVAIALSLLAGFPTVAFFGLVLVGVYALVRLGRRT